MKVTELRQKTIIELNAMLASLAKEQFNLRMQKSTQQLSKPDQIKKVRREIARVQTIVKELAGA